MGYKLEVMGRIQDREQSRAKPLEVRIRVRWRGKKTATNLSMLNTNISRSEAEFMAVDIKPERYGSMI